MKLIETIFDKVLMLEPTVYNDERGYLLEVYNNKLIELIPELKNGFSLEYFSKSKKNTVRGLHYQVNTTQGKLVTAINGSVFDAVVDIRKSSPTFGEHKVVKLNSKNNRLIWIPPGFAHGFQALTDEAILSYKCTGSYSPPNERCILWSDTDLNINWPNTEQPILSAKDQAGTHFKEAEYL